jgi:hypothetical protein
VNLKGGPDAARQAEDRFVAARRALLAEGGGVGSSYYHPCEFVHKEFWDGVNFRRGANPPREQWQPPPAKSPDESRAAYELFENYVRFIKRHADVRFVTASEAAALYRDQARGRRFTSAELRTVAAAVGADVGFQKLGDVPLAASEVFALLNGVLLARLGQGDKTAIELEGTPDGPSSAPPAFGERSITDWSQFTRTAADVADYLRRHRRVPTTVWLGSLPVPPEVYLSALAQVVVDQTDGTPSPPTVELRPARLAAAKYVADDDPKLWGWVIFPPGFRAPALMDLAKRQAWTLKPAVLDGSVPK